MKKIIKCVVKIILFPFLVIFNPLTFSAARKIKEYISSFIFGLYIKSNIFSVRAQDVPYIKGGKFVVAKGKLSVGRRLRIDCFNNYNGKSFNPEITIGDGVSISDDCHIGCINKITIGDGVLIGSKVLITDHEHGAGVIGVSPSTTELYSKGAVSIGDNTFIGDNAVILSGVSIGKNCIIGANTVVNKSFDGDGLIIAGAPAKTVKRLGEQN